MNIVIDAFGGDNAPLEVIKGSIDAQKDFGVDVTLVGDEEKIRTGKKLITGSLFSYAFILAADLILSAIQSLIN